MWVQRSRVKGCLGWTTRRLLKSGVVVALDVIRVPGGEFAEDAEAEVAGTFVLGEVDPDGGVVVGFVGDLDGVAEAGSRGPLQG